MADVQAFINKACQALSSDSFQSLKSRMERFKNLKRVTAASHNSLKKDTKAIFGAAADLYEEFLTVYEQIELSHLENAQATEENEVEESTIAKTVEEEEKTVETASEGEKEPEEPKTEKMVETTPLEEESEVIEEAKGEEIVEEKPEEVVEEKTETIVEEKQVEEKTEEIIEEKTEVVVEEAAAPESMEVEVESVPNPAVTAPTAAVVTAPTVAGGESNNDKKKKKKKRKAKPQISEARRLYLQELRQKEKEQAPPANLKVEVEYVAEEFDPNALGEFSEVFKAFQAKGTEATTEEQPPPSKAGAEHKEDEAPRQVPARKEPEEEKAEASKEDDDEEASMTKKRFRKQRQVTVADLKESVERPDVVEVWDVTSFNPRLLVHLKSYRNTVPVPRHWCQKRKYLLNKRGVDKIPYDLPDFIRATGIQKIRETVQAKDAKKNLKSQARDRVAGKVGALDIDYQILHDAFFRFQSKPKLTRFGDQYYENKENEVRMTDLRPGTISQDLRVALGLVGSTAPPPWLVNMQRYGPPPSYPDLQLPGLNAPIPKGCAYGYHAGGWGKPPVDDNGMPLYGDPFGMSGETTLPTEAQQLAELTHWGEAESEESESEAEEEEEDMLAGASVDVAPTPSLPGGAVSTASVLGAETPDTIDLRRPVAATPGETPVQPKQLYQVLQQKDVNVGQSLFGSAQTYVLPEEAQAPKQVITASGAPQLVPKEPVAVALNPSELESLDEAAIKQKFERIVAEEGLARKRVRDEVSDATAEGAKRQEKKRKKKESAKDSFKF